MKILRNISDLKKALSKIDNLGFVPTMGGLHPGHISLIKASNKKCNKTLVSIYVNPKQFNNKKDFISYPRKLTNDINVLKKLKTDFIYLPNTREIYKRKRKKKIVISDAQKVLCAKYRKGHFEGVLDIMDRLTYLINPKYIFLGEKDYQQLFLIRKYLNKKYRAKIIKCKIIRDKNYVALSTRNYFLSTNELKIVGFIARKLNNIKIKVNTNQNIINTTRQEFIKKFKIKIEYLEVRSESDLTTYKKNKKFRIFIAYYLNNIRLIDNF
tara:strand:+ start:253 stop:1056 length:804 start_codon:yes stop_codon:yes gene_type:complete